MFHCYNFSKRSFSEKQFIFNFLNKKLFFFSFRYPKSTLSYQRIQNTLRNHAYKEQENESDEDDTVEVAAPDTATDTFQVAMVNDTVERVEDGEIQNQSFDQNTTNESLYIDCIEDIKPKNEEKSIEFQDVSLVTVDTTFDRMKPNPSSTYTCVDLISEVFEHSVEPTIETANNTLDSTCVRISKTANELRKTQKLTGKSSRTKVNLHQTPEKDNEYWALASPPQQQANKKFIRENPSNTTRTTQFITSDLFNESNESLTGCTLIERNSNGASTTSTRIVKMTNELRNTRNRKSSEPSIQEKTEDNSTLLPMSHEHFVDGITDKNSTRRSSPQRANKRSHHNSSSTSTDGFVMMRISEADVNRLIKRGHVCFVQGQFQYHEPNQE